MTAVLHELLDLRQSVRVSEVGPAADEEPCGQIRVGSRVLADDIDRGLDIVITGLHGHDLNVGAFHGLFEAADTLFEVGSAEDTGQDRDLAAVGQDLHHFFRSQLADSVVVRAAVERALGFRGVGVEAADNDTGVDRSVDDVLQSVSVVAADQDAVDLLFDQAFDDGDLLAGVRGGRADPLQVDAQLLGLGVELGLDGRLDLVEGRIVHELHDADLVGLTLGLVAFGLAAAGSQAHECGDGERAADDLSERFIHSKFSLYFMKRLVCDVRIRSDAAKILRPPRHRLVIRVICIPPAVI